MPTFRPALLALVLAGATQPATAASFVVTRTDDPPPDACLATDCSLREAVIAANGLPGPDVVVLSAATYVLSHVGNPQEGAQFYDLDVTDRLEIVGAGSAQTIVRAAFPNLAHEARVIQVVNSGLTLRGLSLRDGRIAGIIPVAVGGCLRASGSRLTLQDVQVSDCIASPGLGGAIYLAGGSATLLAVTIKNSYSNEGGGLMLVNGAQTDGSGVVVQDNEALANGGGVAAIGTGNALRWAIGSQVVGNRSGGSGGGIRVAEYGSLLIEPAADATPGLNELLHVSANTAGTHGGGLSVAGTLTAQRLKVTANIANSTSSDGGGLHASGTATVIDSEFTSNGAVRDGGGVAISGNGSSRIERSSFVDNIAGRNGGAVSLSQTTVRLVNVSTFSNEAAAGGGGVSVIAPATIVHLTTLSDVGGGLRLGAPLEMRNSVIAGGCKLLGGSITFPTSNRQAGNGDLCPAIPITPLAQLALGYGYYGGRFNVVGITSPSAAQLSLGNPSPLAPNDIRGWTRVGAVDLGAIEYAAVAP
ncbi:MAG: CSLREA domain-containing protein [Pseudomonadota bacterium]|jgi:CSLREA domain-containing protein